MTFKPIQKLDVMRTLSSGERINVGVMAQNSKEVFFQYDAQYIEQYGNLSPFSLKKTTELQIAPRTPHQGIHGVFGDCLPDGWGMLLQDRIFRQHGMLPTQITAMDRLAFVGHHAIGALSFEPISDFAIEQTGDIDLATMGLQAQALFDGQTDEVLSALVAAGSSGGARPKAQIYLSQGDITHCRTRANQGDQAWLIKFTSQNLPLGHEEGLCEAAYLSMAEKAGLEPPNWQLFSVPTSNGIRHWLAVKRFDWVNNAISAGRYHMHSACGLLDADFRAPTLDYEDLIKASRQLCKSPAAGQLQFSRSMFNLFAGNQDDHSKNWSFLQDDDGNWEPAPFYDATFSPHPFGEHATAFAGFGKSPPLRTIQKLATHAGFSSWKQAQLAIGEVVESLSEFKHVAAQLGIKAETIKLIGNQLDIFWQQNKQLLKP
ncbi:type II toxin-antitoxin system HipA family toxin [Xenorhabdus sp. 12]|uniref:Type II toxin-antitoxin system HipA family toxin n=1 Tax=Xenorhabdus santafensis TaxID=2582833 RepID=A0ABU4S6Q7_9GAMM|nr:type II toxin-antitoxin system HipA family toxin [Xenorhabdus sp. 12]MDX7986369.1 type II toxin-antitoxin system HipA family toxin [Xenorhabdus sp. 12]